MGNFFYNCINIKKATSRKRSALYYLRAAKKPSTNFITFCLSDKLIK